MTGSPDNAVEQEAVAWCIRVRGEMDVADWRAFTAWLDASLDHRAAYDAVEAFWEDLEAPAAGAPVVTPFPRRPARPPIRRSAFVWSIGGLAAAAAVVLAVLVARSPAEPWREYATPPGQLRTVALEDGSRLVLGPATTVRVRLAPRLREVELVDGASTFDVAHLSDRPFEVTVGDRRVRVVGTEFDIVRRAGRLMVTVRRGLVAVSDPRDGRTVRLGEGQELSHQEGATDQAVRATDPDRAFGWTQGRLYYDDTPLAEVAADLSRYGPLKVRVASSAISIRVSGVLRQDDQPTMIRRLEAFIPIRARFTRDEVVLEAR
ncbi:FecR family protein [Caulobacter soli]|uniref:FecR family protein n=1 Tax=Caulobacter soli TaxID=2708539 RepID=UPI0013EC174C|nr:FecR domain-containing protein [Caulobacter soli]